MSDHDASGQPRQACNLEYLLVNLGRNHEAATRLVRLFLENHPKLEARLDDAVLRVDPCALKDVVHDVRSSCVLFSAQETVEIAREIEQSLHAAEHTLAWQCQVERLKQALTRVAKELKTYLADDPA